MNEKNTAGRLFVLSGPSGCGKNTVYDGLCEINPDVVQTVSMTTRAPRENETDGKDYYFVTKEEFFKRIDNGEFLEYVNYGENYYGTLKCEINRLLEAGKTIVMVIEVCGALNIKKAFPDSTSIFLLPPSVEVLSERLRSRGQNSEEDIRIRLSIAMDEMKQKDNYDYCVINDDLKTCVDEINAIIQK